MKNIVFLIILLFLCSCNAEKNRLIMKENTLFFQSKDGRTFEITKDAHPFDYDIFENLVVYVSKTNGKLYLYDHTNKITKILSSPEDYYCNRPKFYKNQYVFYTVMDKPEYDFNWPTDPFPGYLYISDLQGGAAVKAINLSVNNHLLKEYKDFFVLGLIDDNNMGLILFDPNTKKFIKISEQLPSYVNNNSYIINGDTLVFMDSNDEITINLNCFATELSKQ